MLYAVSARKAAFGAALASITLMTACNKSKAPYETVVCWGGGRGQIAQPPSNTTFVDYDVISNFVCGATDKNTLICWGDKSGIDHSLADYPEGAQAKEVRLKYAAGCIIDILGRPYCWGSAGAGSVPASIHEGDYHALRVKPSIGDFACAINNEGRAACWGKDYGNAFSWLSLLPQSGLRNLELGSGNVCWSSQKEKAFHCTGEFGGKGFVVNQEAEVDQIVMGSARVCAIAGGDLNCYNMSGQQIGHDADTVYMAEDAATCFIRINGTAVCYDITGGTPQPFSVAGTIPSGIKFSSIRAGGSTACGAEK